MGRFCLCFLASFCLILKVLWDGIVAGAQRSGATRPLLLRLLKWLAPWARGPASQNSYIHRPPFQYFECIPTAASRHRCETALGLLAPSRGTTRPTPTHRPPKNASVVGLRPTGRQHTLPAGAINTERCSKRCTTQTDLFGERPYVPGWIHRWCEGVVASQDQTEAGHRRQIETEPKELLHCSNYHKMTSSRRYICNNLWEKVQRCQRSTNSFAIDGLLYT